MISWFSETKKLHFNLIIKLMITKIIHRLFLSVPLKYLWLECIPFTPPDTSKTTQILDAYPISFWQIIEDFLFCCKLTLQTEHCYFPRCAMTPKMNTRHKQQCVRPVELRELSILPGQSSHVIFIFKFYWVFGIPHLNKQVHVKSAWS